MRPFVASVVYSEMNETSGRSCGPSQGSTSIEVRRT